ncbi:MAG TPA: sialidase family protein, partial [Chloroflexota bacterium]|nr:sialidase family protein [Chloroflexota bacterium]
MSARYRVPRRAIVPTALVLALVLALSSIVAAIATTLTQISSDPFTNTTSQHQTQVEPDTFSNGSTIVATFQQGRFTDGGSSDIGFATSQDGGTTWTHGNLPGTTTFVGGTLARISDPSVAFDASHNTWLISGLGLNSSLTGVSVTVNRSTDGGLTWANATNVATVTTGQSFDKEWITCDSTATSPFYGHCYVEWDDNGHGNTIKMSTSTDGGLTWGAALQTANNATGIGGQPVVQPSGTVVVPMASASENAMLAFVSTNGGTSWGSTVTVSSPVKTHAAGGGLRSGALPSAAIDGAGKVYLVWEDCRFETSCSANDIVMTKSSTGSTWSAVTRIPIDAVASGVDHFIPGIDADKATSGS